MSFHGDRIPKFISATTEANLQIALTELSLSLGQKLEIMTIYPRGGKIVAWYFLDMKLAHKVPAKKVTKKKVVKKKG